MIDDVSQAFTRSALASVRRTYSRFISECNAALARDDIEAANHYLHLANVLLNDIIVFAEDLKQITLP